MAGKRTPGKKLSLLQDHRGVHVPLWRESLLGVDWLRLKASKVYYGLGVPHGDGSAVVLVPGFMAIDLYLSELYLWLWRIGYKPYMSNIGHNAECPNLLIDHLLDTVRKAYRSTGKRVHLIGHSLGGVLARGAAQQHPELLASVITLGAPYRGVRVHPWVLSTSDWVRNRIQRRAHLFPSHKPQLPACYTTRCQCGFACSWREDFPESVRQFAIYTKSDGIVDWRVCINGNPATDIEVSGTHCGLTWNPDVYRILAERLALPPVRKKSRRVNGKRVKASANAPKSKVV